VIDQRDQLLISAEDNSKLHQLSVFSKNKRGQLSHPLNLLAVAASIFASPSLATLSTSGIPG
jgi:hypothetical protein